MRSLVGLIWDDDRLRHLILIKDFDTFCMDIYKNEKNNIGWMSGNYCVRNVLSNRPHVNSASLKNTQNI